MAVFFEDLHLDLGAEHRERLRRGFEWPARAMFEDLHRQRGEADEPRTADSSWSPVIFDASWVRDYDSLIADHAIGFIDDSCVPDISFALVAQRGAAIGPNFSAVRPRR